MARDVYLASSLPRDCLARPSCIKSLHQRVGTDRLYLLTVVRIAQLTRVDISRVDGLAGTVRPVAVVSVDKPETQRAQFRALAASIVPGASARPKPMAVAKPQKLVVKYVREPRGRHVTSGVWLAGSIAVAAGASAVVTGLFANDLYKDLERAGCKDNPCDRVPELRADRNTLRRLTITTDVLIGVSLTSAVVAGYLYWTSSSPGRERSEMRVGFVGDGRSIGVGLGGSF
jgi:hypothetical protein